MAEYKGYYHRATVTVANLTEIGVVNLDDMGTLPFFSVHYRGKQLPLKSENHCAETKGDCYDYVHKYLDIKWKNAIQTKSSFNENKFESIKCGPEHIT